MTPARRVAEARPGLAPGAKSTSPAPANPGQMDPGEMVVMGRVAGPFGIKGWIKVQCFTQSMDNLLDYPAWWLGSAGEWDENRLEEGSVHGRSLIAKLEGCDDREAAARLKGLEVAIPQGSLPANAEGEYYWSELIGLAVANREGVSLGQVKGLIETGANQVLVVRGERERLIPFVGEVVLAVDVAGGTVIVDWGADY